MTDIPASAVGLIKTAYGHIEHSRPPASLDGASRESRDAAEVWRPARQYVLEALDWRFARRTATLAELLNSAHLAPSQTLYALPSDCLAVRSVGDDPDNTAPYTVVSEGLITAAPAPVWCRYTADVKDPVTFAPAFERALGHYIAYLLAPRYTSSQNRANNQLELYRLALEEAAQRENPHHGPSSYLPKGPWDRSWVEALQ